MWVVKICVACWNEHGIEDDTVVEVAESFQYYISLYI